MSRSTSLPPRGIRRDKSLIVNPDQTGVMDIDDDPGDVGGKGRNWNGDYGLRKGIYGSELRQLQHVGLVFSECHV